MKKYIVPTINVQTIELTDMIAASPQFTSDDITVPTTGSSTEKTEIGGPGHEADGMSKGYNVWDAWED